MCHSRLFAVVAIFLGMSGVRAPAQEAADAYVLDGYLSRHEVADQDAAERVLDYVEQVADEPDGVRFDQAAQAVRAMLPKAGIEFKFRVMLDDETASRCDIDGIGRGLRTHHVADGRYTMIQGDGKSLRVLTEDGSADDDLAGLPPDPCPTLQSLFVGGIDLATVGDTMPASGTLATTLPSPQGGTFERVIQRIKGENVLTRMVSRRRDGRLRQATFHLLHRRTAAGVVPALIVRVDGPQAALRRYSVSVRELASVDPLPAEGVPPPRIVASEEEPVRVTVTDRRVGVGLVDGEPAVASARITSDVTAHEAVDFVLSGTVYRGGKVVRQADRASAAGPTSYIEPGGSWPFIIVCLAVAGVAGAAAFAARRVRAG